MASDFSQINALDPNSLSGLKRLSKDNSPEAIKESSKQFEALFLQQVLKSMRDASPPAKGSLTDSDESRMYQSLLDQQMSLQLASRGGGVGLARVIERQLLGNKETPTPPAGPLSLDASAVIGRSFEATPPPAGPAALEASAAAIRRSFEALSPSAPGRSLPSAATPATAAAAASSSGAAKSAVALPAAGAQPANLPNMPAGAGPRAFVERVWPQAVEASRATGIPARFLVAQAALETGWGKHELKNADGSPSHNLFNIKAGSRWSGDTVDTATREHRNGVSGREGARFRAYGSYAESFRDYARLIGNNPRYAGVVGQTDATAFARGLQSAGYATDPLYADKLARIINGNTLRTALAASAPRTA